MTLLGKGINNIQDATEYLFYFYKSPQVVFEVLCFWDVYVYEYINVGMDVLVNIKKHFY